MEHAGMQCVWGEWTDDSIAGWTVTGDKPHHLIVYATHRQAPKDGTGCPAILKDMEFVYVWDGKERFEYGEHTVRKITPGTRYYVEVHNHDDTPLHVRLQSFASSQVPKYQSWIVVSALVSGRVGPGETKAFDTPQCVPDGDIVGLRMHSHYSLRHELFVGNQSVLDTKRGDLVNKWYEATWQGTQPFYARCTYDKDSAVGMTWCDGCQREMCNAYAQISVPFDRPHRSLQTLCL